MGEHLQTEDGTMTDTAAKYDHQQERRLFEHWMLTHSQPISLVRDPSDEYGWNTTAMYWRAWQARAAIEATA